MKVYIILIITCLLSVACKNQIDAKNANKEESALPIQKRSEPINSKTEEKTEDQPTKSATLKDKYGDVPPHVPIQLSKLKKAVLENNKSYIAHSVKEFPIKRPNSVLHNKEDFIAYYDIIFDDSIKSLIANMNPTFDELIIRGGRYGILNGKFWFNDDGQIIRINYESVKEKEKSVILKQAITDRDHKSLDGWDRNLVRFETESFFVHVYYYKSKGVTYASWKKPKVTSDKPDLILSDGEEEFQGTMGGVIFRFTKGNYTYEATENRMAPDGEDGWYLKVYDGDALILEQKAIRVFE